MQQTARNGGLIMMHAENGMAIDVVAAQTVAAGTTDPIGHGLARKAIFEGEATNRVIRLAEAAGVPVYIVHLSARDALEAVRGARASVAARSSPRRARSTSSSRSTTSATGSTAPSSSARRRSGPKDHWDDLWTGLVDNDLQLVATDHCPFDFHGQKELGRGDFRKIPNGLPGVEDRIDLLHDGGVLGGTDLEGALGRHHLDRTGQAVRDVPEEGRDRGRGGRRPGRLRPERKRTISARTHHMDVDYSCYEGRVVQGASQVVMSRGSVVVRDGEFTGRKGDGRFIKRCRRPTTPERA